MMAIDFFCGGGGITKGLSDAGIRVLGGVDVVSAYRETYEKNNHNKFVNRDIREITVDDIYSEFPEIKNHEDELLLAGCAPCQPFSLQRRIKTEHVDRDLLWEFGRIIAEIRPAHVIVENVPGLEKKGSCVLEKFLNTINNCGYKYATSVINAKNYGVPQNRRRFIIIASRMFSPQIPEITHGEDKIPYKTVRDTIGHYPPIQAGENSDGPYPNHAAARLTDINLQRIRATPHSGGSRTNWPKDSNLILECHKKHPEHGHTDVYGRMDWEAVAPTLTSRCPSLSNGRYGHPEQDRAISLREAAALQTFPDDYIFYGTNVSISKQIGNAVPVKLAQILGEYILREMKQK